MKDIGRLSGQSSIDDCSLSTIEKGVATDLCKLHLESNTLLRKTNKSLQ
jgi:hypothetical protein